MILSYKKSFYLIYIIQDELFSKQLFNYAYSHA